MRKTELAQHASTFGPYQNISSVMDFCEVLHT